jgi:RNA polymerase sigma factor (sigma-70 family)
MDVLTPPALLGDLFAVHRRQLARTARRILGDPHRAEDAVHDAYVKAMETAPAQAGMLQPLAYLQRLVRNLAIDRYRRCALESQLFEGEDGAAHVPAPVSSMPEAQAIHREDLACVARALSELPERVRRVFELYRIEGRTQREIGAALGLSAATVNTLVREALDHCRAAVRGR